MSDATAMSFKARMKAISKEFNLRPQTVIQNCMFERFLTPDAIEYSMPCCFKEGESLLLKAYTVETVLAEKCESILKRNVLGTRPRDYYDVYALTRLKKIRKHIFRDALSATFANCGTTELLKRKEELLDSIISSTEQQTYWKRYQREFSAAAEIDFNDAVESVRRLLK